MEQVEEKTFLRLTEDNMAVLLSCDIDPENLESLASAIYSELVELEVENPPSIDDLVSWLGKSAEKDTHIVDAVLIEGTPVTPSEDGQIVWAGDFFNTGFVVDRKTGAIDYRRRAGQCSVEEGQHLAKLIPVKEGEDGRDVLGNTVPARKPRHSRIRVGTNVRWDKQENALYAQTSGRIRWVNYLLYVDPVYTVSGSVGLQTGHIDHPGALLIEEDIEEGAEVKAKGDIEVHGVVEGNLVETTGNLIVHAGITRAKDQHIRAKGSVHAKFIIGGDVEADGDIVIEREITDAQVKTKGIVNMPRGRVAGGTVSAFGGMIIGQAGSRAGVPTTLIVGEAGKIYEKQQEINRLEEEINQKRKEFEEAVEKFLPDRESAKAVDGPHKQLVLKISKMVNRLKVLHHQLTELRGIEVQSGKGPFIEVKSMLHPETTLWIDAHQITLHEVRKGPVRITCSGDEILFG
jgi:hypothetical protein